MPDTPDFSYIVASNYVSDPAFSAVTGSKAFSQDTEADSVKAANSYAQTFAQNFFQLTGDKAQVPDFTNFFGTGVAPVTAIGKPTYGELQTLESEYINRNYSQRVQTHTAALKASGVTPQAGAASPPPASDAASNSPPTWATFAPLFGGTPATPLPGKQRTTTSGLWILIALVGAYFIFGRKLF